MKERRAWNRIPVNLEARLFYGNMVYTGRIANLTERGMFICTKMHFPAGSLLLASIKTGDRTVTVPVRIIRTVAPGNDVYCVEESGIGAGLLNPSTGYSDFVKETRALLYKT